MKDIRRSYKVIFEKYEKIGKGTVRLTQSSLLLLQPLNASSDTYKFPILETDNAIAPQPEEIRLNQNDEFISYEVAYYVSCNVTVSGVSGSNKFFLTYAPIELVTGFRNIIGAWMGVLSIAVNKISRLERWDLKKHNIIPRTQFQSGSEGIPGATIPSLDYSEHGTIPMQPMLTLSGAKKNDIVITLNAAISATAAGDWTTADTTVLNFAAKHLVLGFRGMLAQNAAKFQG